MNIIVHNRYEPKYGELLSELMLEAFGFSFAHWYEWNQWDERYESYSIHEDGRMLSNVCIYKTEMFLHGRPTRALQVGAVATTKDARMRGLCRAIMEHIIRKYPETPMFLHANPSAAGFYPKFGFRLVQEFVPTLAVDIHNDIKPIKLRLGDAVLMRALDERGAYSGALDCANTQTVQIFHLLMDYGDCVYHIPELDVVVLAEQQGETLLLADVIAKGPVSFDALEPLLPFSGVSKIEFGFCPDWLGVSPVWTPLSQGEHPVFVRGEWDLPAYFRIPVTSVT